MILAHPRCSSQDIRCMLSLGRGVEDGHQVKGREDDEKTKGISPDAIERCDRILGLRWQSNALLKSFVILLECDGSVGYKRHEEDKGDQDIKDEMTLIHFGAKAPRIHAPVVYTIDKMRHRYH